MWIQCACGNVIKDVTDSISYKARYISDQDWFDVLDRIDSAIKSDESNKDHLCQEISTFIMGKAKDIYQCTECGRIYIDDKNRNLKEYVSAKDTDTNIFRSKK